jgi:hypothetical protein
MIGIKEMVGVCCCVLFSHVGFSQVKLNTNFATGNMNSNTAFLDGSSSNSWNGSSNQGKGLLFPRVDLTTLAAMSMAGSPSASNNPNRFDGMLVYNTGVGTSSIGSISVTAGFYYYKNSTADIDGGTWQPMSAMDLAGDISSIAGITTIGDGKVTDSKVASGISASKVGLGSVENTADADKVISDAAQIALDDKENIANKSLDINIDAASDVKFPSVKAIKTYVDATGSINAITAVTSTYSATESDYIILCNTAGSAFSLTLPAASAQVGKAYIIRKTDISANTMTISPGLMLGSTVISGVNYPITIEVVSDGTDWNIIK